MKYAIAILVLFVIGCAPLGGQAVTGYADHGGQVTMHVYITDGGTELDGIFYRPKVDGNVSMNATTQPSE